MRLKTTSFIALIAAASLAPSALAWDDLYVVGGGTPAGWHADQAIKMQKSGDVFTLVTYLYNDVDGRSFRIQSAKSWECDFIGGENRGQRLENGQLSSTQTGNDNGWSVPENGFYCITFNQASHEIKVERKNFIGLVGSSIAGKVWQTNGGEETYLKNTTDQQSVYTGIIQQVNGDFKINIDPQGNQTYEWDREHYIFRDPNDKQKFITDLTDTDSKWTVGYPDQSSHAEKDLDPGRYFIQVEANYRTVDFIRKPYTVTLTGPGVGIDKWYTEDMSLEFKYDGDNQLKREHVFFKADQFFKPVIDKKVYGSSDWNGKCVAGDGNGTTYLRQIDIGGDLSVSKGGFRDVYVRNSGSKDGTMDIYVGEPQDVWVNHLSTLVNDNGYYKTPGIRWYRADGDIEFKIGEYLLQNLGRDHNPGWYIAAVENGNQFHLYRQDIVIKGSGADIVFDNGLDYGPDKAVKHGVFLEAGTIQAEVGSGHWSNQVTVSRSGIYNIHVTPTGDNSEGIYLEIYGPFEPNMPLKEADFANGQRHYFLVGQRMGAWRLQPEWEFTPAGDGTLTIPTRLLYNGYIMVGMVDNYADYTRQIYTGWTYTDTNSKTTLDPRNGGNPTYPLGRLWAAGRNGCTDGKFTGTRYNEINLTVPHMQHGSWDNLANNAINVLDPEGFGNYDHLQSDPSRVETIRLRLDGNGNPSELSFEQITTDPARVAEIRTFSLCGSHIFNTAVTYDDKTATTPLNHDWGYSGNNWSEGWIQYDSYSKPYVDANGEYIYQTVFTRDWLKSHPTIFRNGDFEFTSDNITFNYDANVTHEDQFGQRTFNVNGDNRTEILYTYSNTGDTESRNHKHAANNLNDIKTVSSGDRVCFVVENMWMQGTFKIWSGWGGSLTDYEYDVRNNHTTRWYRDNAGHGAYKEKCAAFYLADQPSVFTLFEDMIEADFGIGYGTPGSAKVDANGRIKAEHLGNPDRHFFNRVEIWYNLRNGFVHNNEGASFMLFYQEKGGPTIYIGKANENQIHYTYEIPLVSGLPESEEAQTYGNVTYYKIERIRVYPDGSTGTPEFVAEGYPNTPRPDFKGNQVKDNKTLDPGIYQYKITTKRQNTGNELYTALSNRVQIDGDNTTNAISDVLADSDSDFDMTVTIGAGSGIMAVSANDTIGDVEIYAVNGMRVHRGTISDKAGTLNVSGLADGIYLVRAHGTTRRVLKH